MIYWIQYRNDVERADKSFNPIKAILTDSNKDEISVIRHFRKGYLFSFIPITKKFTTGFEITKGDKTAYLDNETYKVFRSRYSDADQVFNAFASSAQRNGQPLSYKGLSFARNAANILAIVLAIVFFFTMIFTLSDKNFSSEKKTITNINQLKRGDYVELNAILYDFYQTSSTTTRRGNTTERKSNTYSLGELKDQKDANAIIVKSKANSFLSNEIDQKLTSAKETELIFISKKIKGEVKKVSEIEKLDQKQQVVDYFKETTDTLKIGQAEYLIDTNIEQANLLQTLIPSLVLGTLTIALIGGSFFIKSRIKEKIKNYYNI